MKYLLHRSTALLLALLLLLSAMPAACFAFSEDAPTPLCELGTFSGDMISGGGRQVQTDRGLFYLGPDGCIYREDCPDLPVYNHPAARLNYCRGELFFARQHKDSFDLVRFNVDSGREVVLLKGFSGTVGQVYLVDGRELFFRCGDEIWSLSLADPTPRKLFSHPELWSFVPTGCGLIYAVGALFDYDIYAGSRLLVSHADNYYVDFDTGSGLLVYTVDGTDLQMDLASCFRGSAVPEPMGGRGSSLLSSVFPSPAAAAFDDVPGTSAAEEPEDADQLPPEFFPELTDLQLTTGLEDEAPQVAYAPEADFEAEDASVLRRSLSASTRNIVKRARQMLEIRWTPRKDIQCWKYSENKFTYKAGTTYRGLPYGQPVSGSYVPWTTSLPEFVAQVNNDASRMYTMTAGYGGTEGPYYSVDCSGFASWAWDLPYRCTTDGMLKFATKVSPDSYTVCQTGDILYCSDHVVLVTDVTYNEEGTITGIEISESTPVASTNCCCRSIWYRDGSLAKLHAKYFASGYTLYRRSAKLDPAVYTHECIVPLEGDECPLCGEGMFLQPGVDVSYWQGDIDWTAAAPHLSFAIIRMGYSTVSEEGGFSANVDPQCLNNIRGCIANGVPFGLYYYSKAMNTEQAGLEAEEVITFLINNLNLPDELPTLPIFYDVEDSDTILKLNNADLLSVITAFNQSLEDVGFLSGIYSSTSIWDTRLKAESYNDWYHWVAQWGTECSAKAGAQLWQFSCNGTVPGISTVVDLNYWFGSVGNRDHRYKTCHVGPTCTEAGSLGYTCVDCGESVTRVLDALGHSYVDGVCNRCGQTQSVLDRFTDVDPKSWYAPAVAYCVEHGLFNGVSDTKFAPHDPMDRAMIVTVLWRLAGSPPAEAEHSFTDLRAKWYKAAVAWAAREGIVAGTSPTTFSPTDRLTREQAATFLYRYARAMGADTAARVELDNFPDGDKVSNYAKKALSWAVAVGLITGTKEHGVVYLAPKGTATRAQVATILMRFSHWMEPPEEEEAPDFSELPTRSWAGR